MVAEKGTGPSGDLPGPSSSGGSWMNQVPGETTGGLIPNNYTLEFDRPKQVRAYYKPFRELTNGRCLAAT